MARRSSNSTPIRRQWADIAALTGASTVGVAAGVIHPVLGIVLGAASGTLFASAAIGVGAALIAVLGATVVKMGIATLTNPLYLVAMGVGLGAGFWLRRKMAQSQPEPK